MSLQAIFSSLSQGWVPSEFLTTMSLNTEQYLQNAAKDDSAPRIIELMPIDQLSYNRDFSVDIDRPLFDVFPPALRFQAFEPMKVSVLFFTICCSPF